MLQFIRVGHNAITHVGGGSAGGSGGSGSGIGGGGGSIGGLNASIGGYGYYGYMIDLSRVIWNGIGNVLLEPCKLQCSTGGI